MDVVESGEFGHGVTILLKRRAADPRLPPAAALQGDLAEPRRAHAVFFGRPEAALLRTAHIGSANREHTIVKGEPASNEPAIDMAAPKRFSERDAARHCAAGRRSALAILRPHTERGEHRLARTHIRT